MQPKPRTTLLCLVFSVVLANVLLIVFTLDRSRALPPLPNPNGYDDFTKAAALATDHLTNANTIG